MAQQQMGKFALQQRRIYVNLRLKEIYKEQQALREEKKTLDEQLNASREAETGT